MAKRASFWQILIFSALVLALATAGLVFSPMGKAQAHPSGPQTVTVCKTWAQVDPNPPHCVETKTFTITVPPHGDH